MGASSSPSAIARVYGPRWPWLFALYLALAIICGYQSWSRVVVDPDGSVWTNQTSVDVLVSSRTDHPIYEAQWANIRARVLLPLIIVGAHDYLHIPYRVTHDGSRLLFIFAALLLMHWHLRSWFTPLEALAGTVIVIASITTTFNGSIPTVTEFPELVGMTACVGLLLRRRVAWMLVVFAIATLNRETSIILLPVAFCLLYDGPRRIPSMAVPIGAIALTWVGAYLLAHHLAGNGAGWIVPAEGTNHGKGFIAEVFGVFIDTWPRRAESMLSLIRDPHPYNVNWSLFLVLNVFWILPLFFWRTIPETFKRLYVGGLLGGLPIFLLVGVLNEAGRHMIPLYPLVMPAGLFAFTRFVVPPSSPLLADGIVAGADAALTRSGAQRHERLSA